MRDFARLEDGVVRRAQTLRGLRWAGFVFAGTVCLVFAAAVVARLRGLPLPLVACAGAVPLVGLCAWVAHAVGRRRRPDLPELLLALDLALGTDELLCSLHEVRAQGGSRVLRTCMEEKLERLDLPWRRVLRPRWRDAAPWVGGMAALAGAAVLALTSPPPDASLAAAAAQRAQASPGLAAERAAAAGEATIASASAVRVDAAPGDAPPPLVDTLAEILTAPPSGGLLGGDVASEGTETGQAPARGDAESLSRLLSEILGRATADMRHKLTLTDDEKQALREILETMPGSSLRDALSSALTAEPGDELRDKLAESQRVLDSLRQDERGPGNAQTETEPQSGGSGEETDPNDAIGWIPDLPAASGQTSRPGSGGRDAQPAGEELTKGGDSTPASDEGGMAAGVEGTGKAATRPAGADFVPEELLGSMGSEGALRRFFTKGIPFEPPPSERGEASAWPLDHEALRGLLEARVLAPNAQALVRAYFEELTQGGP